MRLVAAHASTMRFSLRASHVKRAALPDQILFGLFLPDAELMLADLLHGIDYCGERQMLVQHLDRLSSDDLLCSSLNLDIGRAPPKYTEK